MQQPAITAMSSQESLSAEREITLAEVDRIYQSIGCLGHGGFGSVFLGKKRSGRHVALKFMRIGLDDDEDEVHSSFTRELDAVLKLECTANDNNDKDLSIVYFRDWFRGPNFACIVMQHADGGTLAREIESRQSPYTERRICWYALQLSEALAHAHSRGVFHYDVKGTNVLIDATGGGRLLLADFGSAVSPGEEGMAFTKLFAAPELQAAYDSDDYTGLEGDKVDAFALGCLLFELVCAKRLCDFAGDPDATLGKFIAEHGADAALGLGDVRLPWLPPAVVGAPPRTDTEPGYSSELGHLIKSLLEPHPNVRYTPKDLAQPLRHDVRSPLLAPYCSAALVPQPGDAITVDNIQLGMFVQRGHHWNDGETDGGQGSIGVVVKLDPDAQYTEVAFPLGPKPLCCRIGAGRKYELQVGPTPMKDYVEGTDTPRQHGNIYGTDTTQVQLGQKINDNCIIVASGYTPGIVAVAPLDIIPIPPQPIVEPSPVLTGAFTRRKPMPKPSTWNLDIGLLVSLGSTGEERQLVQDAFFSSMDIQEFEIVSIHAVQSEPMWDSFAKCCEEIAINNWSNPNQRRLFHGTGPHDPERLVRRPEEFRLVCSRAVNEGRNQVHLSSAARFGDRFAFRSPDGCKKILLSRVALGRINDQWQENRPPLPPYPLEHHSVHKQQQQQQQQQAEPEFTVDNPLQVYPEFIVTYKRTAQPLQRRMIRARRPSTESARTRRVPERPRQIPSPAVGSPLVSAPSSTSNVPVLQAPPLASPPAAARNTTEDTTPGGSSAKMCVVCWENPVSTVNIPCGHPTFCAFHSTKQALRQLNRKCPECRQLIRQNVKFYGKVVNEE